MLSLFNDAMETLFSEANEQILKNAARRKNLKQRESVRNLDTQQLETVIQMNATFAVSHETPHAPRGASAQLFELIQVYAKNAAEDALKMAETRNLLIANAEDELLLGDREVFKQKIQDTIYKHLLNANIR